VIVDWAATGRAKLAESTSARNMATRDPQDLFNCT
jgi:hypothetical protein